MSLPALNTEFHNTNTTDPAALRSSTSSRSLFPLLPWRNGCVLLVQGREDSNSSLTQQHPTGNSPGSCFGSIFPFALAPGVNYSMGVVYPPENLAQPPFYQSISPKQGVKEGFWNKGDWLGPRKHLSNWWTRPALGEKRTERISAENHN